MKVKPKPKFFAVLLIGVILLLSSKLLMAQVNPQLDWVTNTIDRIYPKKEMNAKKIKNITVELDLKRDNSRIEKTGKKFIYSFSNQGTLDTLIQIIRNEYGYDSIVTFYYTNKATKTDIIRTFNKGKYFTIYNTKDDYGRIIKTLHCEETNLSDDFRFFKLGNQVVTQSESYRFEPINDNQLRKKFSNDNNIVFKEGIIYTEGKNKLIKEENYQYIATGVRLNYSNVYDEKERVIETIYTSDASGDLKENSKFTYDKDILLEEKYYRNNAMRNQRFFFYNKENSSLESILSKSTTGYTIEIYNFTINFY
jgi:hypothetical protein